MKRKKKRSEIVKSRLFYFLHIELFCKIYVNMSKVDGVAYCRYQPNSEGVYPLFANARTGRLFLHLRWSDAPTICSSLHRTDPCATHTLSW